jgi:N,N'-diacetyllegionaminate synthase
MYTTGDIENTIFVLEKFVAKRKNITVLHFTSEYPAPIDEINLNVIGSLMTAFEVEVEYSDHTT